jgi:hypothetical protein
MSTEVTLSAIVEAVGSVWALLVILIWATHDRGLGNKKLVSVFVLLNTSALIALTSALYGLYANVSNTSIIFDLAMFSGILFIFTVAIYYIVFSITLLVKK